MIRISDSPETRASNGVRTWLKAETLAFIIQTLLLLGSLVYGYTKLESKVDETNRVLLDHIEKHNIYLQKDVWEVRNRFVDEKLNRIENKQDQILQLQMRDIKLEIPRK